MDWLERRRDLALQQEQIKTNSLAKRRRSSAVRPATFLSNKSPSTNTSSAAPIASRLLALPPELRDLIYHQVFLSESPRIKPTYTIPGLLLTCRQTFSEAVGLYYSLSSFRCLDEDSTVSWLANLPTQFIDLIPEIRYDTRWIILTTPFIPIPGGECWLFQRLVRRLGERGVDVNFLGHKVSRDGEVVGEGRLKVSFYETDVRGCGAICWTDKPGLIEGVRASQQ